MHAQNSSLVESEKNSKSVKTLNLDIFTRISSYMLKAKDEADFMNVALSDVGQTMDVSRTYTFSYSKGFWSNTYEWTAPNITSEIANLQNLPEEDIGEYGSLNLVLKTKDVFIVFDINEVKDKYLLKMLNDQNITGCVFVPIFKGDAVVGVFGVDQCNHVPNWSQKTVSCLIALASLISSALTFFEGRRFLQQKRNQVHRFFDILPFPIYVSNKEDYSILFSNKIIYDSFSVDDLSAYKCHKLFQNLDEPCPFCTNQQLKPNQPPYIWHHYNPILSTHYKVIDSSITWEGKEDVRLSVALDITEQLRLQQERVLEREANVAKGQFIAIMSHELRTPLNGIIGLTRLAEQVNTDPAIKDFLDKIKISSNKLLQIINETLDMSLIEKDELKLDIESFNLNRVLYSVQSILQVEFDRKNNTLEISIDNELPMTVDGDSLRLSQIVLNLTNNALKFTEQGTISLNIYKYPQPDGADLDKIAQTLECNKDALLWVRLDVKDTGIGISPEQQTKLFKEFSQVEASTARKYGGTGLGLSIVQRFVHLMCGEVQVESEVGKGSTFSCIFPLMIPEKPTITDEADSKKHEKIDISGTNVLLVEDNDINALIAIEVLENYGCHVDHVVNGAESIEAINQKDYDIVLMDIQMPIMDGLTATLKIRSDKRFDKLPIIAMSAHAMVQDYEKSKEVGMQDHIAKPFDPEVLCQTIYNFTEVKHVRK